MERLNEEAELIDEEGLSLKCYLDSEGNPTIGVGHLLKKPCDDISLEQAGKLLAEDIKIAKGELREKLLVYAELDPVRQYVLLSMCFNMGIGKLLQFKRMIAALESKNYAMAAWEMQDSKWFKQVKRRGTKLCSLMSTGHKS